MTEPVNPIRALHPVAKLIGALVLVIGIVLIAPLTPLEIVLVAVFVSSIAIIGMSSLTKVYIRSLIVLPVAGAMAALAPLRYVQIWSLAGIGQAFMSHWTLALELIVIPWLCVLVMMVYSSISSPAEMLEALEALKLPHIFVLLLTFIYRYIDTLRAQVVAMRRALVSRAPSMSARKQVLLYGNLAGALLIRSYDRGDRIYNAMLSRGFTGTLPRDQKRSFTFADAMFIAGALLFVVALALL